MATAPVLPQLSLAEYEQTPKLFDRFEYVDGCLIAKPVPTWKHSQLQIWIGALLMKYAVDLAVGSELHSKLREGSWRIPDVAVQRREIPVKRSMPTRRCCQQLRYVRLRIVGVT